MLKKQTLYTMYLSAIKEVKIFCFILWEETVCYFIAWSRMTHLLITSTIQLCFSIKLMDHFIFSSEEDIPNGSWISLRKGSITIFSV